MNKLDTSQPGDWQILYAAASGCWCDQAQAASTYLEFVCPCGCGEDGMIPIRTGPKQENAWRWDGNVTAPTLDPSIFCTGQPCKWHGYFIAGQWRHCPDSRLAPNCKSPGGPV